LKFPAAKSSVFTFLRAQFSAFAGGMTDYAIMIALTEWVGIHYTISIAFSGMLGAIVNFSINRYWTFKRIEESGYSQLPRFAAVVAGSIFFKSTGTYLLTEALMLDYRISRLLIDAVVSLGFNFTMQKYWVFRKK
jgi:putative flippase GtrA